MTAMLATRFEVVPTEGPIGADIVGLDAGQPLDAETVAALRAAWMRHSVLRLRDQRLTLDQLEAFSRNFGELDRAPITESGEPHLPDHPFIAVMSNIVENGRPIGGLGYGEAQWHTDMSYKDVVPMGSLLYSVEVPPSDGNTSFADMYGAWESLPADLARRVEGLRCKHDASTNSGGFRRAGFEGVTDPRVTPGALHPVVITHPESGRKALYLGRRNLAYLDGLPLDESEALLDELWRYAARPELVWTQCWRVGDIVMWDNRCTLHHRTPFDPTSRRLMWRTQIQGPQPL